MSEDNIDELMNRYMFKGTKFLTLVKVKEKIDSTLVRGELEQRTRWTLYKGRTGTKTSPYLILDTDGYVHPNKKDYTIVPVNDEGIAHELSQERSIQSTIKKVLWQWNVDYDEKDLPLPNDQILLNSQKLVSPVPMIRDLSVLRRMDWVNFVDSVLEYRCRKDPNLKLFQTPHLLRGFNPALNAHGLCATNPGPGKTLFYEYTAIRSDRMNKKTFLGFAKSPEEVFPGLVADQYLPIVVDQIESQDASDIFGYLYSAMQLGIGNVDLAATRIEIRCWSPFVILANIQEYREVPKGFRFLLYQMCRNVPAMGKRIAEVLYNNNLQPIRAETSNYDPWIKRIQFFRGVEESALNELRRLYFSDDIWEWSKTIVEPTENYLSRINEILETLLDEKVRTFFTSANEQTLQRIKGCALNSAIAYNLADIALGNYDLNDLKVTADDEWLPLFVNMNIESITNIAERWDEESERIKRDIYDHVLPKHLKELASSVHFYTEEQRPMIPTEIPAEVLGHNYHCLYHDYLSQALNAIKYMKNKSIERYNTYLRHYFGFEIQKRENDVIYVRFYM